MRARPAIAWVEEWMSWRAFNVLPYLAERFDVTYVTTGDEVPPANFKEIRRFPKWKHMMLAGFSLSKCVDRLYQAGKIDLAVVYASIGFAIRKTPFVEVEGGSVYREIQIFSKLLPWYQRPRMLVGFLHHAVPEILCVRRARKLIVNSHSLKQDLMDIHRLKASSIQVIHNGIGEDYLCLFERRGGHDRLGLVYVGRVHPRKGIVDALREFSRRRDIDADFFVLGGGPQFAQVEALAALDGRIKVYGEVSREFVKETLRKSHVFVFPTFYEGFSSALLEAMAAGLACVSYDLPAIKEVLGEAGLYACQGDVRGLIDLACSLIKRPEVMIGLGEVAHKYAGQFSWAKCAMDFEEALIRTLEDTCTRSEM